MQLSAKPRKIRVVGKILRKVIDAFTDSRNIIIKLKCTSSILYQNSLQSTSIMICIFAVYIQMAYYKWRVIKTHNLPFEYHLCPVLSGSLGLNHFDT